MNNKSVAYMLAAVVVGYMLISAVPGQIAMFATPQRTLSMESGEAATVAIEENTSDGLEIYWDQVNESYKITDDVNLTGYGFVISEVNITDIDTAEELGDVQDLSDQVADLAEQLSDVENEYDEVKEDITDVATVAEDAVAAAEAASEAVSAVASTANTAIEAAADAAEAAQAARSASSGLTTFYMASWWIIDILVALGVYFIAKRRFG